MMNNPPALLLHKYHALGNDYLVLDPTEQAPNQIYKLTPAQAIAICDRHRGVGSDGIVVGPLDGSMPPDHFTCEIWNPDGSQAEVSGNGLRIFARYLLDAGYTNLNKVNLNEVNQHNPTPTCTLHCGGRSIPVSYGTHIDAPIRVELGLGNPAPPVSPTPSTPFADAIAALGLPTLVDVGNPHCVFFPSIPISEALARQWGPTVENDPTFPRRTNVQFVRIIDTHAIAVEIWERGAGYTQASGSSSCAAALAAIDRGYCLSPITVHMPGGTLLVDAHTHGGVAENSWRAAVTGPATPVFVAYWRMVKDV